MENIRQRIKLHQRKEQECPNDNGPRWPGKQRLIEGDANSVWEETVACSTALTAELSLSH